MSQVSIVFDEQATMSLMDRVKDAEQVWRYFQRRDEMNAEIHREGDLLNVRYTPITIAAERVHGWLHRMQYGRPYGGEDLSD